MNAVVEGLRMLALAGAARRFIALVPPDRLDDAEPLFAEALAAGADFELELIPATGRRRRPAPGLDPGAGGMNDGGGVMRDSRIVIVGAGEQAEIAYEYFTHDSEHEVVAFAVERAYLPSEPLYGLPVVPFEELAEHYGPSSYDAFVAVSSTHLNQVRERLFHTVKARGYRCPS